MDDYKTPFQFVKNIQSENKVYGGGFSKYIPFIINRSLSQHMDSLLYAQEINKRHDIPKEYQYLFLYSTIQKKKRPFKKWVKPNDNKEVIELTKMYNLSPRDGIDIGTILDEETINRLIDKGGKI